MVCNFGIYRSVVNNKKIKKKLANKNKLSWLASRVSAIIYVSERLLNKQSYYMLLRVHCVRFTALFIVLVID